MTQSGYNNLGIPRESAYRMHVINDCRTAGFFFLNRHYIKSDGLLYCTLLFYFNRLHPRTITTCYFLFLLPVSSDGPIYINCSFRAVLLLLPG